MQHVEVGLEQSAAEQERLELVLGTLARLGRPDENLAEVAHDARNMVTALGLYCELLKQPGVLSDSFQHYASELQLVTAASHRLVDKLSTLDTQQMSDGAPQACRQSEQRHLTWADEKWRTESIYTPLGPPHLIENLEEYLLSMRNLLAALAGPGIALSLDAEGGARPVHLSSEDLTRILVNLVKNSSEAMHGRGQIHIRLGAVCAPDDEVPRLLLTVEDNGAGLPDGVLKVLSRPASAEGDRSIARATPRGRRGLGLAITRSIVEAAGGRLHAANRDPAGACLQIELPVRSF